MNVANEEEVEYPRFRIVTGIVNNEFGHELYDEVMHDIHVAKTGRYQLVDDKIKVTSVENGTVTIILHVVDNGPRENYQTGQGDGSRKPVIY